MDIEGPGDFGDGFSFFNESQVFYDIEAEFGIVVCLLGGEPIPLHGFDQIFGHSQTLGIYLAEVALGLWDTLLGSKPIPFHGFGVVFGHSLAFVVPPPEAVLGLGVPMLG